MKKLFKSIDMRLVQNLVMLVIIALFLYLFFHLYSQYSSYRAAEARPLQKKTIIGEVIEPPRRFHFTPPKEERHKYQLFTFKEKKNFPAAVGKTSNPPPTMTKADNFKVIGVIKRDKLFLVVRSNGKIRYLSQGMEIDNQHTVRQLTPKQAVIIDSAGRKQVHKIFPREPVTTFNNKKTMKPKSKK